VRSIAALAAASVLAAVPAAAADVTLVGPGGRVALSEAAQSELSDIVKRETESCSISSTAYPEVFPGRDGATDWQTIEGGPHLYVRYEPPVVMRLGRRGGDAGHATEVLIGLADPKSPGQPLTRHDGVVTLNGKCSGGTAIELMCQPALRPYFEAKTLEHNCRLLPQIRRRPS
jgi:hypothetical protein